MGTEGAFVGAYERSLTTPATKTGFANVFVASPPKKGGEFLHYLLVGCVFPSIREFATPRG
jgi:hypothetical protein